MHAILKSSSTLSPTTSRNSANKSSRPKLFSNDTPSKALSTPSTLDSKQGAVPAANCLTEGLLAQVKTVVVEAVSELKNELRLEYQALLKDLERRVSVEINSLRKEISTFQDNVRNQVMSLEKELLSDFQEAELRKNNVMIFGLKECNSLASDGKDEDLKSVKSLSAELGVRDFQIRQCYRLGRRGAKPRPLKVTCDRPQQRLELLQSSRGIPRLDESLGFRRVFIKPDLSPKEQLVDRELRQELKRRRDAGERVFLRGGKVVVDDRSSNAQLQRD